MLETEKPRAHMVPKLQPASDEDIVVGTGIYNLAGVAHLRRHICSMPFNELQ